MVMSQMTLIMPIVYFPLLYKDSINIMVEILTAVLANIIILILKYLQCLIHIKIQRKITQTYIVKINNGGSFASFKNLIKLSKMC